MQHPYWKPTLSLGTVLLFTELPLMASEYVVLGPYVPETHEERQTDEWAEMLDSLESLWSGTYEERLEVALESEYLFDVLDEPDGEQFEQVDQVVSSLQALFETESDAWILDRLAAGLAEVWTENLNPLFREALSHPSPNVRWRAVYHFTEAEDPSAIPGLEEIGETETRPWILIDLMQALDLLEVDGFTESCLEWTGSDDIELVLEAIGYISYERPAGTIPALIDLAEEGPIPVRAAAVGALAGWPDSRQALDVVIEASGSSAPSLQLAAITALDSFPFDEAWRHLDRMARTTTLSNCSRAAAAAAIAPPEVMYESWLRRYEACGAVPRWSWKGYVTPPGTMDSIRCWRGPEVSGEPDSYPRIPANTLVRIFDRFEARGEMWIEMEERDCWIPFELVTAGQAEQEPDEAIMETELDITVDQLDTRLVEGLLEAAVIEVIDPERKVVGLVLTLACHDRDAVERLLDLYEPGADLLHTALSSSIQRCIESDDLDEELLERARSLVEPTETGAVAGD